MPRDLLRRFRKVAVIYLLCFILNSIKYVHYQLISKVYRIFPEEEEEILLLSFTFFKVTSIEKHTTGTDQQYEIIKSKLPPSRNWKNINNVIPSFYLSNIFNHFEATKKVFLPQGFPKETTSHDLGTSPNTQFCSAFHSLSNTACARSQSFFFVELFKS